MKLIVIVSLLFVVQSLAFAADGKDLRPEWHRIDEGQTGIRQGSVLVHVPELKQMLLVGLAKDAPFVQAFDPETKRWAPFSTSEPFKSDSDNYNKQPAFAYQVAYDPQSQTLFCLSMGQVLYAFDVVEKSWKTLPAAPELEDLAWPTMACDPFSRKLVVVGAEKKGDQLGWSRTAIYDIASGTWQRMEITDERILQEHQQDLRRTADLIDLGGRIRLAWYRDPQGVGTEQERTALRDRCRGGKGFQEIDQMLQDGKLLDALRLMKVVQSVAEGFAEQYPVPCSRRNSPLVFDPVNKVFVMFGGDHQDYLMNDTWILDLDAKRWRRAKPKLSPSPRAGHALVPLAGLGIIALYEGYVQSTGTDYGAMPWSSITPVQLWLYDVKADRWDLFGTWAPPEKKDNADVIAPVGYFYGGEGNNRFAAPAMAIDDKNRLVLAAPDTQKVHWNRWHRPAATWMLELDTAYVDIYGAAKLGVANQRLYRPGLFRAEFCEDASPAPETALDQLPANQWVKLAAAPRNPASGCRGRDWSTSVWDPDRDQILLWGGGHCVRSSSTVLHYSPVSGRIVEGYDAEESYGSNSPADGTLAFDSTVVGRPWVAVHNYKHYAYDSKCKLLVSGRGYLYDPSRMDWLRQEKQKLPYDFRWGSTVLASSPHGVVAWALRPRSESGGLWIYDRDKGWIDLEPQGKLFVPWCDTHGMVYDSTRDRMLLSGVGGGYGKTCDGTLLAFDFATRSLTSITPQNIELGKTGGCLRELAYAEHADWMLLGLNHRVGDPKTGTTYTRVYDCANNKYVLLDAGNVPDSHESGWMYDSKRRLVYSFSTHAEAWALRIDPATAKLIEEPGP